ncbi:MAG TPA: OmpH family outer membrane protein, partial [bacterium]|nr:OmpH family outer membrane protein [bacterium]
MHLPLRALGPRLGAGLAALLLLCAPLRAAELRIAVVNMNKALNTSESGERSKKLLLAARAQKESELKAKEADLRTMEDQAKNNIMLTDEARAQKQKELQQKEAELRQDVATAQQDLQNQERQLTESIFTQLRTVIAQVAKEQKYDLVLEQAASQVILYSSYKFVDITDEVI